jgi:hypothetical protein
MSRIFANKWNQKALRRAWLISSLFGLTAVGSSGCSIMMGKPPTDALFRAEQSVRAATEAKAGQLAPVDFRNATEKLERSKRAMAAKRYEEARRFAESAQVDAELAEAKAEAEITRQAAQELRRASMAFGLKPGAAWDGDIQRSRQGVNKE